MWTITTRPLDLPHVPYVVRVRFIGPGGRQRDGGVVGLASTLDEARRRVAAAGGESNLGREASDSPVIVETWV